MLHNQLSLVLRDDLLAWHTSRTTGNGNGNGSGSSNEGEQEQQQQQPQLQQEVRQESTGSPSLSRARRSLAPLPLHFPLLQVEAQLRGRVDKNVQHVLKRIGRMAPADSKSAAKEQPPALPNKQVFDLIQAATSTENLSQMSPTWMPWL